MTFPVHPSRSGADSSRPSTFSSSLDLIAQREYPDVHNELLTEAERRMEALHGAA
jgi:hypothetical protein